MARNFASTLLPMPTVGGSVILIPGSNRLSSVAVGVRGLPTIPLASVVNFSVCSRPGPLTSTSTVEFGTGSPVARETTLKCRSELPPTITLLLPEGFGSGFRLMSVLASQPTETVSRLPWRDPPLEDAPTISAVINCDRPGACQGLDPRASRARPAHPTWSHRPVRVLQTDTPFSTPVPTFVTSYFSVVCLNSGSATEPS